MVWQNALVLLDTQCNGNWISARLVKRLGLGGKTQQISRLETRQTASGKVSASEVIKLTWKFEKGQRVHECTCYVFADTKESSQCDVLFGKEYIVEEKFISINHGSMNVLTKHEEMSLCMLHKYPSDPKSILT
jgi:hypothetical protein